MVSGILPGSLLHAVRRLAAASSETVREESAMAWISAAVYVARCSELSDECNACRHTPRTNGLPFQAGYVVDSHSRPLHSSLHVNVADAAFHKKVRFLAHSLA